MRKMRWLDYVLIRGKQISGNVYNVENNLCCSLTSSHLRCFLLPNIRFCRRSQCECHIMEMPVRSTTVVRSDAPPSAICALWETLNEKQAKNTNINSSTSRAVLGIHQTLCIRPGKLQTYGRLAANLLKVAKSFYSAMHCPSFGDCGIRLQLVAQTS